MQILQKLVALLRGGAREMGDAIVDDNAIRILEQEIVDQEHAMDRAKNVLTDVMADQSKTARKVAALDDHICLLETQATDALAKKLENLAVELAEKIANLENERADLRALLGTYNESICTLKAQIHQAEKIIQEHRRELTIIKTTANVQRARLAVSNSVSASVTKATSARESLNRIKARQQHTEDRIQAAEQLHQESEADPLKARLAQAGVNVKGPGYGTNAHANDVLSRLQEKYKFSENLLKNLIVIAMANNRIHENERSLLTRLSTQMGADQALLSRLIREVMHGDRKTLYPIKTRQELEWLCHMAKADGTVTPSQRDMLVSLALPLHITADDIQDYLLGP